MPKLRETQLSQVAFPVIQKRLSARSGNGTDGRSVKVAYSKESRQFLLGETFLMILPKNLFSR